MMHVLTDEEAVAHSDALVERVAKAMAATCLVHKGASIDALSQVLFMVNGATWMEGSDMARARIRARQLTSQTPTMWD